MGQKCLRGAEKPVIAVTLVLYDTFFLVDRTWAYCIIYTECIFFQKIFSRKSRALGI